MDIIIGSVVLFLVVGAILAFTLGSGQSSEKSATTPVIPCPPGFSPSLAYKEKYGNTGIAYDEKQKAIYILNQETHDGHVIPHQDILAAAVFEDESLVAKSARRDEPGKQKLSKILTEEIKVLFQDKAEQTDEGQQPSSSSTTSNTIDLRILIHNPDQPVHQIHFLNMEAKKGGVIHNEAMGHVKNWQDLLSFLIRSAEKPASKPHQSQPQPEPEAAAVGNS